MGNIKKNKKETNKEIKSAAPEDAVCFSLGNLPSNTMPHQYIKICKQQASDESLQFFGKRIDVDFDSYILGTLVGQDTAFDVEENIHLSNSKHGGSKAKLVIPILMAVIEYLQEKPSRKNGSNYEIANNFKNKVNEEENKITVIYEQCEWDVFHDEDIISARPDTKIKKCKLGEVKYSTFQRRYISEVKKIIAGTSAYNEYIEVPKSLK